MQADSIVAARLRLADQITRTPLLESRTLSRIHGVPLFLKFENLQFTASFKERGALHCLLCLDDEERRRGVIAMSSGNHAQAVAYHAARLGVPARIVMPRSTPNVKVAQTRVFGAEVELFGNSFEEARRRTAELAREHGLALVHPFDDPRVVAGQGTLGLEIVEQLPEAEVVVVPVGGGGLIGGVALAVKSKHPEMRVVGVQMERFPAVYDAFHGRSGGKPGGPTVSEGIAIETPGSCTLPLVRAHVDDMLLVGEEQVEQAVLELLEIEKTVVEGAGAAPLAAVAANPQLFAGKRTVLILSGGNIDMLTLSTVVQRGLLRSRRLLRIRVEVPDAPEGLADLTRLLADLESPIVEIHHQRLSATASIRSAQVELVLKPHGGEDLERILAALAARGYQASPST